MNTLYITSNSKLLLDENLSPHTIYGDRVAINNIYLLKEDTDIVYCYKDEKKTLHGKAGDIVVTFYEDDFPNKAIIISSEEWKNNIETYNSLEQKRKEEWAANKNCTDCCGECPERMC